MRCRAWLAGGLVLLLALGGVAATLRYQLLHAWFESSLPLSTARKSGPFAASMGWPAQAKEPDFEVFIYELDTPLLASLKASDQDPADYVKANYFGITEAAHQQGSRRFASGLEYSEVYRQSAPRKDYLEMFWLERPQRVGVMLAFRVSKAMPMAQANAAINEICATFDWKI